MPGTAIGKSLALGYAGKVSRNPMNKIDSKFVKSILNGSGVETLAVVPFGAALVLNTDNTVSLFGQTGAGVKTAAAAAFAGIAVAEVKQAMTYGYGANSGGGQYEPAMPCDRLVQGTATVICTEGTPTAGGAVYIVTVAGSTSALGAFVATSTPACGTAVALPNCQWATGKQDASGICELTILWPVSA